MDRLDDDHPVFNCVYDLRGPMSRLQVPTSSFGTRTTIPTIHSPNCRPFSAAKAPEMHVHALLDDRRRMMILAIHNSDVSDCWEREGENELYFRRYSERIAYPLGINIIFYLMTH